MPKISVIVPLYKAEKYIRRCVDSILAQTFTDFELLLIDDGSPDNSGAICDEYAASDSRVKVFHKENGGVSSARNVGLDNACGEWITFVDADDWIVKDYLQLCIYATEKYNLDLLKFDLGGTYISEHSQNLDVTKSSQIDVITPNEFIKKSYSCGIPSFIRKNVLGEIRFNTDIKYAEDQLFIFQILDNCEYCGYLHKQIYNYMLNPNSATKQVDGLEMLHSSKVLLDFLDSNEKYKTNIYRTVSVLISQSCLDNRVTVEDIKLILSFKNSFTPICDYKLTRFFFFFNFFSTRIAVILVRVYKILFRNNATD